MKTRQRRRHERACARFPVWIKHKQSGTVFQGHTANVSNGGMYLLTSIGSEFELGTEVSVEFGIRDEDDNSYVLHRAHQGAQVVRLEKLGYGTGVALMFTEVVVSSPPHQLQHVF
jgi:c-di-GMP-binding flagellar brake protein YcgR